MKIVTAEQMQHIDRMAASLGLPTDVLMENAGRAVAEEVRKTFVNVACKRILTIVGPGNNGGDGLVAARHLTDWGAEASVYLCKQRAPDDKNLLRCIDRGIAIVQVEKDIGYATLDDLLARSEAVIDAVFGTGRSRVIDGIYQEILTRLNTMKRGHHNLFVFAVDMPSGLDANTGDVDACTPTVNLTITLGYPKPGLYLFPGAERAGKIVIADIGISPHLAENISTELITRDRVRAALPRRPASANKGTFGKALVIAGSINYSGAAYLSCMGAAKAGAGLVTLAAPRSLIPVLAAKLTEITYVPLSESEGVIAGNAAAEVTETLKTYKVMLMGCGIGQHKQTANFVKAVLNSLQQSHAPSLILDADALNILAQLPQWWQKLTVDAILTPHPGEMARLCGLTVDEVQRRRLEITRESAQKWNKVVVLKGAYTIIAAPDGRMNINGLAYAGLATAGTGDVLAGIIAGLNAQGLEPFDAATCGVYLHGEAGIAAGQEIGDTGLLASDLLPAIPKVIKGLKQEEAE